MEHIKEVLKKSKSNKVIHILVCIFIALLIFQAGMFVGFKKASFSFRTGEQYFRQMNGRQGDTFLGANRADFSNSHGAIGKIININLPNIVVADKDGNEKTIIVSTSTNIRKFREEIRQEDLKVNDIITVIGEPTNKAEVEARLIRVMPDLRSLPFNGSAATGTQIN
jgi:hypothetical protein